MLRLWSRNPLALAFIPVVGVLLEFVILYNSKARDFGTASTWTSLFIVTAFLVPVVSLPGLYFALRLARPSPNQSRRSFAALCFNAAYAILMALEVGILAAWSLDWSPL